MAKDKLTDYDATAANNTDVGGISVDEGMLPSNVNNAIREVMSHLKDFAAGTQGVTAIGVDTISETTADNGVVVDSVTLKDGEVGTTSSPVTINLTSINGSQIGGRRNLIINGAMTVAQRGTSSTGTAYATVDRIYSSQDGTMTSLVTTKEQSSDSPNGFSNSFKITTDTAQTVASDDYYYARIGVIEGQDVQHLNYGASSAKTMSLSFWVKSSETGVYAITNYLHDDNRSYPITYTINSANTWEYKTLTISGDTVGVIDNDNGRGFEIYFLLSAGSNLTGGGTAEQWQAYAISHFAKGHTADVAGTANATWQITGIQLEVGSTATEFEHRSFAEELALCQRYCIVYGGDSIYDRIATGHSVSTIQWNAFVTFPVEMRTGPTESTSADSDFALYHANTVTALTSLGVNYASKKTVTLSGDVASGLTTGRSVQLLTNATTDARLTLDAEL